MDKKQKPQVITEEPFDALIDLSCPGWFIVETFRWKLSLFYGRHDPRASTKRSRINFRWKKRYPRFVDFEHVESISIVSVTEGGETIFSVDPYFDAAIDPSQAMEIQGDDRELTVVETLEKEIVESGTKERLETFYELLIRARQRTIDLQAQHESENL